MRSFRIARFSMALGSAGLLLLLGACGQSTTSTTEPGSAVTAVELVSPAASPVSDIVGMQVDDFQLLDHQGAAHQLYSYNKAPAIVLMTQGNGCPIVRNAIPALREIRDAYASQGVMFFLLNSNLQDNPQSIAREVTEFGFDMTVLVDENQLVGESLGVTRTAEIFVIDTSDMAVVYHGPVDDRLNYQAQKATATHAYLADALDAVIAGDTVRTPNVDAPGCLVNFPERDRREKQAGIYQQHYSGTTVAAR
jgi:peroxiredoxin